MWPQCTVNAYCTGDLNFAQKKLAWIIITAVCVYKVYHDTAAWLCFMD